MTGNDDADQQRWSVGELARATGLTVRALHHYDEIGLVRPSERTHAGHRRYTDADVRRLYRVRALRSLGLSLEEVGAALGDAEDRGVLRELLTAQLDHLTGEVRRVNALRTQVGVLLDQLDSAAMPGSDEFLTALETMTMIEKYYSQDQLDRMAARRDELGEDGLRQGQRAWGEVIGGFGAHRAAGTAVDDPEVRALAERWMALVGQMHGDDAGIKESMKNLWLERRDELNTGVDAELWDYVRRAIAAAGLEY
jgi:DNA-binding transcriptional MerR regulator